MVIEKAGGPEVATGVIPGTTIEITTIETTPHRAVGAREITIETTTTTTIVKTTPPADPLAALRGAATLARPAKSAVRHP